MNIELSELKKIIQEEIENRFGGPGVGLLLERPESNLQSYRGVNFGIPISDSRGNILSEDVKLLYVDEMQNFIDSFLNNTNKKQ